MGRNNNLLALLVPLIITSCLSDNKKEYTNVYWLPKTKELAGTYLIDKEFHEKDKLSNDSIVLVLNENGKFKVRNFLSLDSNNYNNNFGFIPYSEGKWSLVKNPISSKENDYSTSIIMEYTGIYDKYNKYDKYLNKNNKFLEIQEMQMKISDSSFIFCFFTGDPDHDQYRYYFHQIKK